jgi:DNA-binding NarL/FixJ family response regulator
MNNESFVMYESVYKQAAILEKKLGKETAYDFLKAVIEFGLYGALPDEEDLVWLYGFEQTITSISKAKDRYAAAVENGKKGGRKPTVDKEKVLALKEQGLTNKQVAEELGCSVSSVEKVNAENRKNRKNLNENINVNNNANNNANEKETETENQKAIEIARSLFKR